MKRIRDYKLEWQGVHYPDYFQGAGTAYTDWNVCFTGCGETAKEASEDALEQAAQCDYDVENVEIWGECNDETVKAPEEAYHYVTIYLKEEVNV